MEGECQGIYKFHHGFIIAFTLQVNMSANMQATSKITALKNSE